MLFKRFILFILSSIIDRNILDTESNPCWIGFWFLEFTTTFNMADNIFWWFICEKQSLSVNQNLAMKICCSWGLVRNNRNYSPIFHPRFVIRFCLRRHSTPRRFFWLQRTIIIDVVKILKRFSVFSFSSIQDQDKRNRYKK